MPTVMTAQKTGEEMEEEGRGWHTVTFRCPLDLLDQLDALAEEEDRSRGKIIVRLLRSAIPSPASPPPGEPEV